MSFKIDLKLVRDILTDTNLAPQVLDHTLRKRQLLGPIGYTPLGHILRYHELSQVPHNLVGWRELGNPPQYNIGLSVLSLDLRPLLRQPKLIGSEQ